MTTINCTLDCKYQQDGKCALDDADKPGVLNEICVYYSPDNRKKKKTT